MCAQLIAEIEKTRVLDNMKTIEAIPRHQSFNENDIIITQALLDTGQFYFIITSARLLIRPLCITNSLQWLIYYVFIVHFYHGKLIICNDNLMYFIV